MTRQLNIRGAPNEVFGTSSTTGYPFGTRMHVPDGRVFRRAQTAGTTALVAGRTAQSALPNMLVRDKTVVLPSSNPSDKIIIIATGEIVSEDRLALEEFNEGLLYVVSGGGAGHVYRIVHSARPDLLNNQLTVTIDAEEIIGYAAATTRVTLFQNKFKGLAIADAPPSAPVIGISPVAVPVDEFFWLQTTGTAAVLQEGELQTNLPVASSSDAQGAVRHAVVVVPPLSGATNPHDARSVAVVNTIHPEDRGGSRLAPVTGLGVVPQLTLGYVIDPGYDDAQCLVHLNIEV